MQKFLLITYDYELFLGNRSGSVEDCLIKPSFQSLAILEKHQAKAIFFVDTVYLLQLKNKARLQEVCKNDFDKIAGQLQQIIKAGHYVFPHLHPHWLDAEYLKDSNEWRLNEIKKYRFHHLSSEERTLVFDGSVQLLNEIILPVKQDYQIDCYRAGGWCIQPFEDFKPYFIKNNFKCDMSVMGEFYHFSNVQYFDFSEVPDKNIYRFEDDVIIEKDHGRFVEFNISSIHLKGVIRFFDKVWLKYLYKIKGDHTFTRGQGQVPDKTDLQKPASLKGQNILTPRKERIAVELLSMVKLPAYLRFFRKNNYMHFISHPKMLTQHNHKMFDRFLKIVFSKYEIETDFRKMTPE